MNTYSEEAILKRLNQADFAAGIDLKMMYKEMVWASDGYLHMACVVGIPDADKMEQDFEELIAFWRKTYGRC